MNAWIVRAGRGGIHAAEWLEGGYVAVYWDLDGADVSALDKEGIKRLYKRKNPEICIEEPNREAACYGAFCEGVG